VRTRSPATQIVDAGEDLAMVSHVLGHTRLEKTAIYTQPTARDLKRSCAVWSAIPKGCRGV
jgi:site-specific recombinase XerD